MPSHSRGQRKRKKVPGTELVKGQMKTEQKGFSCWAESEERAKLYVEIKKQEVWRKG